MKTFLSPRNYKPIFLGATVLIFGLVIFIFSHTHADSSSAVTIAPAQSSGLLLYSSGNGYGTIGATKITASAQFAMSDFGNGDFAGYRRELFLSPDRTTVAVTLDPIEFEGDTMTYLADTRGTQLTSAQIGRFVSWAPDSSRALLYVSTMEAPWDRYIYALDTLGKYYDMGLPNGTINADISPLDGSTVYSLTSGGTDDSTIYLRDPQGKDTLLLKGDGNILAWIRWSPKGDKIAFMKSNLALDGSEQSVWVMNPDATGAEKVSDVDWNYPPAFSPDGMKMAFSRAGDIWEYDIAGKSIRNITNLNRRDALHPSYSADGKTIAFSSGGQVWNSDGERATQLTNDSQPKDYPILP